MEQPTESGSDDEIASNNDINDPVDQSKGQDRQDTMGINSSSEAGGSQSSFAGSNTEPKSRSRSPSTSKNRTFKSVNAFINYMHDFKQNQVEFPDKISGSNLFRMAGEQWRVMSQEEKQPYIDGAALVRKQKASNSQKETAKKPERLKTVVKYKKADNASKNNKKEPKNKGRKRKKQQGLYLKVTDSEDGSDSKSSDISF